MRSKLALLFVVGLTVVALPAGAHHAHGNYQHDMKDFDAVITEVHVLNPHSWIYVEAKDAQGKKQLWALEGGGAAGLRRLESEGKGLKVGDRIKIRCHPLSDGTPGCLLGYIKHPDGIVRDHDDGA